MPLESRTILLLGEAFAGQVCCQCNAAANRLKSGRFYCHDCFAIWTEGKRRHHGEQRAFVETPIVRDPAVFRWRKVSR